eukprot:365882-Chlamydomonas_euryale.AAC.2
MYRCAFALGLEDVPRGRPVKTCQRRSRRLSHDSVTFRGLSTSLTTSRQDSILFQDVRFFDRPADIC